MEHAKAVIELKKLYQLDMRNNDTVERLKNHENVLQVVDTTLLKCYIQVTSISSYHHITDQDFIY